MFQKTVSKGFARSIAWAQLAACHSGGTIQYTYNRGFGVIDMIHKPDPVLPGEISNAVFNRACLLVFDLHSQLVNHDCPTLEVASEIELTLARKIVDAYLTNLGRAEKIEALEADRDMLEKAFRINN